MEIRLIYFLALLLGCTPFSLKAELIDLGSELVNDTVQNITWLKDGNIFKTLCEFDINGPIMAEYNALIPSENASVVCGNNGRMNWNDAEKFILALNVSTYLGFNNWRQPKTVQPDGTCSQQTPEGQGIAYRCLGSELGHLFNANAPAGLGNPNNLDNSCSGGGGQNTIAPAGCFQNVSPFNNAYSFVYMSGTEYTIDTSKTWALNVWFGSQGVGDKNDIDAYVWPVRSGQVATKPQISIVGGYIKLDTISNTTPPVEDCSIDAHDGRMLFDSESEQLYICAQSGWIVK